MAWLIDALAALKALANAKLRFFGEKRVWRALGFRVLVPRSITAELGAGCGVMCCCVMFVRFFSSLGMLFMCFFNLALGLRCKRSYTHLQYRPKM